MLSWGTMLYGAALSALLTAVLVAAAIRPRRPTVIATAAAGALLGPLAWNAILRAAHGAQFFTDAPVVSCPPPGKTLAVASSPSPSPHSHSVSARWRPVPPAPRRDRLLAGLAAFLVDVYLYCGSASGPAPCRRPLPAALSHRRRAVV